MLAGTTPGTAVPNAVVLAGTSFWELEISAEGLALMINEVAKLVAGAEGGLSITECFLTALPHVQVGPTEAYDTQGLHMLSGGGLKGMGGGRPGSPIGVQVQQQWVCSFCRAIVSSPLAPGPSGWDWARVVFRHDWRVGVLGEDPVGNIPCKRREPAPRMVEGSKGGECRNTRC